MHFSCYMHKLSPTPSMNIRPVWPNSFCRFLLIQKVYVNGDDFFHGPKCFLSSVHNKSYYTPALKKWGILVYICPSVLPSLRLSFRPSLIFFIKDFSTTMQARVVIFGIQIGEYMLYCGIANQPSAACSSLNLSDFLSFHASNNKNFHKYVCEKVGRKTLRN